MSCDCLRFYNRLVEMIAENRNQSTEKIKSWMRCRLNFNLLRSKLLCIRGFRCAEKIFKKENEDANIVDSDHKFGGEMI